MSVLPSDHSVHLVMSWCSECTTEWSLSTLGHDMMQRVYYRVIIVCTCLCHDAVSVLPMIILCTWSWHDAVRVLPMIIVCTWSWHDAESVSPSKNCMHLIMTWCSECTTHDHCMHLVMTWCSECTTEWSLCTLNHVMMQWACYPVVIMSISNVNFGSSRL